MNFNFFGKKKDNNQEQTDEQKAKAAELATASQLLIVTAATNFGLVVMPETKKPLMFKMEPTDTIATCVERNAPAIAAAVDVTTCLVLTLAAQLPNNTYAANKILALILPDPGVLINQDMVVVGHEEIGKMPGTTASMLQMLVKQMPQEYFAEPTVEPGHINSPSTSPNAQPVAAPIIAAEAVGASEPAEPASAPLNPVDQVVPPAVTAEPNQPLAVVSPVELVQPPVDAPAQSLASPQPAPETTETSSQTT